MGVPIIGLNDPVCKSKDKKDKRLRTSVYIEYNKSKFILDCGPDFRQQMLRSSIDDLDFLLLTHEHNDHVLGLDDLRPIIHKKNQAFPIYGLQRTLDQIKIRFPYAFSEYIYPGAPRFKLFPINYLNEFTINDVTILPLEIHHGKLPIVGYKINDLVYITDANYIPETTMNQIYKCKTLVINSLHQEKTHHSHFVLNQTLEIIKKIQPKRAFLTHISHKMGFHEEVQKQLPKNVYLAYDGLEIEL